MKNHVEKSGGSTPVIKSKMVKRVDIKVEKRGSIRFPVMVLEVRGEQFEDVFFGYAQNLSEGGLCFISPKNLNVGDQFPIEFVLPDNKTKISCKCEVIWSKKYGENEVIKKGIGVKFIDLDNEKKIRIKQVLHFNQGKE